jgi:hypothetical protein
MRNPNKQATRSHDLSSDDQLLRNKTELLFLMHRIIVFVLIMFDARQVEGKCNETNAKSNKGGFKWFTYAAWYIPTFNFTSRSYRFVYVLI